MNEMQLTVQEKTTCSGLEMIIKNCNLATLDAAGTFEKALVMASGIAALRLAITPAMMKKILPLMNTKLGFLTDQDPARNPKAALYPEATVKECFIEAALMGLSPVGNEFNILFGSAYVAKNGYKRKLKELEGFSDLKTSFKVPRTQDGGAIVASSATWKFRGVADSIDREFAVKLQGGMGADAALGKAERRLFKAIYEQLTGTNTADGEVDDEPGTIPTTATRSAESPKETIAEKLEKKKSTQTADPEKDSLVAQLQALPSQFLARARGKINLSEPLEKLAVLGLQALLKAANNEADIEAKLEDERGFSS